MTRTFKNVPLFIVIELAAKVCAFARKRPAFFISIEEYETRGDEKASSGYCFVYFYIDWFLRDFITGKL